MPLLVADEKERFFEFSEYHFIEAIKKAKARPTFGEDVKFVQRMYFLYLESLYKEKDGNLIPTKELKEVNRIFFFLRPRSIVESAIREGRHKGFFKTLLKMDKKRVLSDYRLTLVYIIAMTCWMAQRMHFVRRYADSVGIPQSERKLPLDDSLVPDAFYYMDYGFDYWTVCTIEAFNIMNRNVIMLRTKAEEADAKNNVVMYIDNNGEIVYALSQPIRIKPADRSMIETLRSRVVL